MALELRQISIPKQLAAGELLVRVTCCTVCGSDLHTCSGRRPGPSPCVLGHEIVGVVEATGDTSLQDLRGKAIAAGDRVVWSVAVACDQCRNCLRGFPQKCDSLRKYGHHAIEDNWQLSGGLAESCHLLDGTALVVIDNHIAEEVICPASCATATVASAIRAAGNVEGAKVLVLGAGMLGLTAAAMAREFGAEAVAVCDIDQDRLLLAKSFGADQTIAFTEVAGQFDLILEMSGSVQATQAAIELANIGASIVLVGAVLPVDPISINPEQVVRRLLSIKGVHNYAPQDLLTAVDFLNEAGARFPFADLVSASFTLADVNRAIEYAEQAKPIRIAVRP